MKIKRRILTTLLAVCLLLPWTSMTVLAADSVVFFTDLDTKVGDMFTITGTVVMRDDTLGDVTVHLTYDTSYMQYMEGDSGVTLDSDGNLTFTGSGDGADRLTFDMQFQALQEGSSQIKQGETTVSTADGETATCETGYADVTIAAGDPSKIVTPPSAAPEGISVTVDGAEYTMSEVFSDTELPQGFTAGEFTYEGTTYRGAVQESSGLVAAYLVDDQKEGRFWIYTAETNSFYPLEQILISTDYYIIVLNDVSEVEMPAQYESASIEINGTPFPIWIEPDREGFYIMYAVNNEGQKSLYLYDSVEHTYQRMETPGKVEPDADEGKKQKTMMENVIDKLSEYVIWIVAMGSCLLVVLLVFLIVLAAKLRRRNRELDELYEEFGIDASAEPDAQESFSPKAETFENGDYDRVEDYEDEGLEEEGFDEEGFEDEGFEEDGEFSDDSTSLEDIRRDLDEYYDDDEYEDDEDAAEEEYYDDEEDEDEYYDDEEDGDDDLGFDNYEEVSSSAGKKKKADTFELDFVDID